MLADIKVRGGSGMLLRVVRYDIRAQVGQKKLQASSQLLMKSLSYSEGLRDRSFPERRIVRSAVEVGICEWIIIGAE
jgi:hypothetical protein